MLARICMLLVTLVAALCVVEYVWDLSPLEQVQRAGSWVRTGRPERGTVIRLGVASWQLGEFPWDETIRRYEQAHPDVRIQMSALPEGFLNTMRAYWMYKHTGYDVVVAWADEEIHPFIHYQWSSPDPARRSLIVNVRDYLTAEQFGLLLPGLCVGSSRPDRDNPARRLYYEMPWMGEVLALNYNKRFFQLAGIQAVPRTWEEVERVCEKLKGLRYEGRTIAPLAMNFSQSVFFGQNCYLPMLAAFKRGRGVKDADGRRLDVASPEAVRVFETLKRWYEAGYISPNCMVHDDVEVDLKNQRAAMFPHWQSRALEAMREHGPEAIGVAPTPGADECGTLVSTYGSIVPKCSPLARQAVQFAFEAFSTDAHGFQTAVTKAGKLPALAALYARKDRADLPRVVLDLESSLERAYFFPDLANWPQCAQILAVEFQRYLAGETPTAAAALENVRRRFASEVYSRE